MASNRGRYYLNTVTRRADVVFWIFALLFGLPTTQMRSFRRPSRFVQHPPNSLKVNRKTNFHSSTSTRLPRIAFTCPARPEAIYLPIRSWNLYLKCPAVSNRSEPRNPLKRRSRSQIGVGASPRMQQRSVVQHPADFHRVVLIRASKGGHRILREYEPFDSIWPESGLALRIGTRGKPALDRLTSDPFGGQSWFDGSNPAVLRVIRC